MAGPLSAKGAFTACIGYGNILLFGGYLSIGDFMDDLSTLGPLAGLLGVWEGDKGDDRAPDDDRVSVETNKFRERMEFEPTGRVDNHEQTLYGLRYKTTAWRLGADEPFHEELGYWLWDAARETVMRCFMVPRGVSVIAGGKVDAGAKSFELTAKLGSETFGICSNPFLDKEFRTESYWLKVCVLDGDTLSYEEDTRLRIKGQKDIFHHTDKNTLKRVKS